MLLKNYKVVMKINALGNTTSTEQFYPNFYTKFNNIVYMTICIYTHKND